MATGVNKITRSVKPGSIFESASNVISSAVSFLEGDLLILTAGLLAHAAAEADGATFLGIARVSIASGKLVSPYSGIVDADTSAAITDVPGPQFGVVAKCVSKTAVAWNPGDLAYLDPATGNRGVTSTGTKAIGVYQGAAIASTSAGQEVELLLGHRFPGDSLQF